MDPGRFYVNLEGKYPRGSVRKAEADGVLDELAEKLDGLADGSGRKVIREIYRNTEIYNGPLAGKGPDLVCLANDGFDLKGNMKRDSVFGAGPFKGMHTSYDAHCILPEGRGDAGRLHIEKLAGIMLDHLCSNRLLKNSGIASGCSKSSRCEESRSEAGLPLRLYNCNGKSYFVRTPQ